MMNQFYLQRNLFHTSPKNVQLKSPVAKRPANAQVTLQGWLHKQGSDGLQLWRKRWFVLSELCLYYYKTSDEDKLLGSVLLPSYRVSECRSESRKYAFKLEHANMRTYLLAAESQKSMHQWICALNLACMLQVPNTHLTPSQQQPPPMHSQIPQPLYENAPPKPRRVSDSNSYPQYRCVPDHQTPQKYSHIIYANEQPYPQSGMMERRTPDTYGRSGYDPMRLKMSVGSADYEDIYGKNDLYQPPQSPLAYTHVRNPNPVPRFDATKREYRPVNIEPRPQRREVIARPHSVDFLERGEYHERNVYQPERPKSSLDINQRIQYNENDFYSEQDYANKMRQSAMYLQYRATPLQVPKRHYYDRQIEYAQSPQQYLTAQRPMVSYNS